MCICISIMYLIFLIVFLKLANFLTRNDNFGGINIPFIYYNE